MGRLPPINRRPFDNAKASPVSAPPPGGEVGSRSDPGGGVVNRARALRAAATFPERILWFSLRVLKEQGFHFRRQAPIGRYIVDFVCHRAKLIVELDGSQHADPERAAYDAERTAFLTSRGYRVLRFWNDAVVRDCSAVVDIVVQALGPVPTRSRDARPTSPCGGGARNRQGCQPSGTRREND